MYLVQLILIMTLEITYSEGLKVIKSFNTIKCFQIFIIFLFDLSFTIFRTILTMK